IIRFMLSTRATTKSSNLVRTVRYLRLGAARAMATVSLTTRRRSQLIPQPITFTSPIRLTNGFRYSMRMGTSLPSGQYPNGGGPAGFEDLVIDSQTGRLYASSVHISTVLIFDLNGIRIGSLTPKPPD